MEKTKWVLDPAHSEMHFKARHLMITNVSGNFKNIDAKAETEGEDFLTATIHFTAKVNSIDTGNEQRDQHLKSADFFDAEQYPELKFESAGVEKKGFNEYVLNGNLTIKNITKPVKLEVEYHGIQKDPYGKTKAGFSVNGKINRYDWDLKWNSKLENGGVLVSEEIKLQAEVQMVKL
jgi:polyisoprenoid-binding protein YceI